MEIFDIAAEKPIRLAEAAELLPITKNGKKIHIRTIERWIKHGHKGAFLQGIYIGASLYTSQESISRFAAKCSPGAQQSPAAVNSRKSHQDAKKFLAQIGAGSPKKRGK